MSFPCIADRSIARLLRRVRVAGALLLLAGAQAVWADGAPAVQLGGTVMHADATRSLALIAVGPAGWQLYRAGAALSPEWAIEAVHVDEVVLRAADGRRAVVALNAADASVARPGAPVAMASGIRPLVSAAVDPVVHAPRAARPMAQRLPMSPERAAALRSLPSAAAIQSAQQEFELPAND